MLVKTEIKDRIGYITLNRPEKRNAMSPDLIAGMMEALWNMEQDDNAKVLVLRAEGAAFCAGADLEYLQQLQNYDYLQNLEDSENLKKLFYKLYTMSKPVIAQIQGHALAGGCGLATVCDFSFAVPEAKFGYTEVKIGFIPAIVMVFLIRKLGEGKARELLMSGDLITAEAAVGLGLINRVVEAHELEALVYAFAQKLIKQNSASSMALTKKMIADVQGMSLEEGLRHAAEGNAKARATGDCKRGIASFLNKESLTW
jgi:methylglutaconyl-CoA hydratase